MSSVDSENPQVSLGGKYRHFDAFDPATEWKSGFGFAFRQVTLVIGLIVKSAGVLWAYVNAHYLLAACIFVVGSIALTALWMHRRRCIWECKTYSHLHKLCERLRDETAEFNAENQSGTSTSLTRFCEIVVQSTAAFFREFVGDKSVDCAIRLGVGLQDQAKITRVYRTVARSQGLDVDFREKHTHDIPADKGIAKSLRDKKERGVWIIRSIEDASRDGVWLKSPNDDRSDIKTLLVAPINGFEGGQKVMFGILYITSRKNPFNWRHIEPTKAIADVLGLVFPIVLAKMQTNLTAQK